MAPKIDNLACNPLEDQASHDQFSFSGGEVNVNVAHALSGTLSIILVTTISAQGAKPPQPSGAAFGKPKVVLVELFTSEGCSSCPPADALLRRINGTQTAAGQLIVGISEHVTYWNSLGWSDPYSSPAYTDRQNAYGDAFRLDSVYTPQMVINGAEQIVGSDQAGLARAIRKEEDLASQISVRIVSTTLTGSSLQLNFSAVGDGKAHAADIFAVVADDMDQSDVLRGENSGRTLAHVSVARSIQRIAKLQATPEQTVQIALPPSFREARGHHLILFAQAPGSGRVLGADSKPL